MKFSPGVLNCADHYPATNRVKGFRYIQVDLNPKTNSNDKDLVERLIHQAQNLADQVHRGAANDASFLRTGERLLRNVLAGLLSERAWCLAMNALTKNQSLQPTEFTYSQEQIDLITQDGKTIEVRSSFPRKGLAFAICNPSYEFDVIGPYINEYKPKEISKSIYVRTLFPFDESDLIERVTNTNIQLFLTGGATQEMFNKPNLFTQKSLAAMEDVILNQSGPTSNYKVIPFSKALDTLEIAEILGYVHSQAWQTFEAT